MRGLNDWIIRSILCVGWLLFGAIAYLRKRAGAAALVVPGLLGIAVGAIGTMFHAGDALNHAGSSTGREELLTWSVTFLPLVAGVGHLREARGKHARAFYIVAPLLTALGIAASIR
jgi:hypothetical protein